LLQSSVRRNDSAGFPPRGFALIVIRRLIRIRSRLETLAASRA
jgi:hypothetical protein